MVKRMMICVSAGLLALALGSGPVAAQQASESAAIKRTILQTHDVPGTAYESVLVIIEAAPNTVFDRHTHPGVENVYILEGNPTFNLEGQPTRQMKAGDSIFLPAGVVHWGNAGPTGAKVLAALVAEKGKPLTSPEPAK